MAITAKLPGVGDGTSVNGVVLAVGDTREVRRQKIARIILDAMYQFLGLLDVDGTVLEINRTALEGAGISLDEVVGKPFWDARWWAVSEDLKNRVRQMVQQASRGEFVRCDMEIFGDLRGQRTIFVDFSLTPIRDDLGNIVFLLPEGRNITEKVVIEGELTRKNSELQLTLERLREIDGFKTKFFANVSHELRTPLALILGPVDQLLKESSSKAARQKLEMIKRNAQSLLHQVNDLLDLARIDAQQMPLAYVCANIPVLFKELAADFSSVAQERRVSFTIDAPEELYADVDRSKFSRIVVNLLSNAFKFTPQGGRIHCGITGLSQQKFLLSIQDNGAGVPESLKEQIFSRFAQGKEYLSDTGSGLGLNIVKEFVELHLGTVVVLDAVGGGAIFQVELPVRGPNGAYVREEASDPAFAALAREHTLYLEGEYEPENPFKIHSRSTILVVEDNLDLRHFLYDVLIQDYNVLLAEDGHVALDKVMKNRPDLVITDLMMPDCDGESFVRNLRANEELLHLPILVLSARTDDLLRETFLEDLVQDYLTKPFSPQELRARVRNLVSVKLTVDLLQKELNTQAGDIGELTTSLVANRKSLQEGLLALQISERRWQGLYNNTAVGIALADREGRILKANPALQWMLGYDEKEIVGISFVEITEESQRSMTLSNVHGLFDGTILNYQVQKRYERRDGSLLWANVSASLIPAMDMDGPCLAVIVEDITSRKRAESELVNTQADLARVLRFTTMGELVASIAHEVNQPLSAVVTNSQAALRWLERDEPNCREAISALIGVNRNATLAGEVIHRIRDFLRKGMKQRESVELKLIVDGLLKMLQTTLVDLTIHAQVDIPEDLPRFETDPVQLQQVLLNLLLNSVDALRENVPDRKRTLSVGAQTDRDLGIVVTVKDNGAGVPQEVQGRLFDPLFSTKPGGLGMGLAISRSIVERHGGNLQLVQQEGGGATFVFNIPLGL